ncbi:MAG: hypothetical protein PHY16_03355 [Methylobacter sp.]|nr:hypothetical protein [Methylobacter sp.]
MLQKAWYELSPVIYLLGSIYFIAGENKLAALGGVLLLMVTLLVIVMRIQYRSIPKAERESIRFKIEPVSAIGLLFDGQ